MANPFLMMKAIELERVSKELEEKKREQALFQQGLDERQRLLNVWESNLKEKESHLASVSKNSEKALAKADEKLKTVFEEREALSRARFALEDDRAILGIREKVHEENVKKLEEKERVFKEKEDRLDALRVLAAEKYREAEQKEKTYQDLIDSRNLEREEIDNRWKALRVDEEKLAKSVKAFEEEKTSVLNMKSECQKNREMLDDEWNRYRQRSELLRRRENAKKAG